MSRVFLGHVTAAGGSTPFSADLTAPSFAFTAQSLTRFNDYIVALSTPAFTFVANALSVAVLFTAALSTAAFQFTSYALDVVADIAGGVKNVIGGIIAVARLMTK